MYVLIHQKVRPVENSNQTARSIARQYAFINRLTTKGFNVLWLTEALKLGPETAEAGSYLLPEQYVSSEPDMKKYLTCFLKRYASQYGFKLIEADMPVSCEAIPLRSCKIGVYCGQTERACFVRCWCNVAQLLTVAGFNISLVTDDDIRHGRLCNIDIFIMPGGSSTGKAMAMTPAGGEMLQKYFSHGGKYLGICAGMYLPLGYNQATRPFRLLEHTKLVNYRYEQDRTIPFYTLTGDTVIGNFKADCPVFFHMDPSVLFTFEQGPIFDDTSELDKIAEFIGFGDAKWQMDPKKAKAIMLGRTAIAMKDRQLLLFAGHPENLDHPLNCHMLFNALFYMSGGIQQNFEVANPLWIQPEELDIPAIAQCQLPQLKKLSAVMQNLQYRCLNLQDNPNLWYVVDICDGLSSMEFILEALAEQKNEFGTKRIQALSCAADIKQAEDESILLTKLAEDMFSAVGREDFEECRAIFDRRCHDLATGLFSLKLCPSVMQLYK
ncbi:MAG: BPL-N domain-containing protein [Clostridia bacterium]|nr:BPL-N domain-containing protein [Clostridia bacterium]